MKPSAKRALLLPAWLERKYYSLGAGLFRAAACGLIRRDDGRRGAFGARRGTAAVRGLALGLVGRNPTGGSGSARWVKLE